MFNRAYFDIISSNHFPVHPMYKNNVDENFFKAMPGIVSLGLTLPILWTVYKQHCMSEDSVFFSVSEDQFI